MNILNDQIDLPAFYERVGRSQGGLLMLDYDGTLAPFVEDRLEARPYPSIVPELERLFVSTQTRTVVISGRQISVLSRLLNTTTLPEMWGCHGLEHRTRDGTYAKHAPSSRSRAELEKLPDLVREFDLGNMAELKPSGVALHWRGALREQQIRVLAVAEQIGRRLEAHGFCRHPFDGGVEWRVRDVNKGQAVARLLKEVESPGVAAYCGDDLTDEDAFIALGDCGLKVLVRSEIRETAADIHIVPPDELLAFLTRWP